jgi:beta-glucosidase
MNTKASIPEIVGSMSLEEKVGMLSGEGFWHTKAIPRLGVSGIMMTDGPHGLRKQTDMADHLGLTKSVPATCYPPAVTLASSWDTELAAAVGAAIGDEARAEGVAIVLGPGINMKRSPLCGRNFEYYSEDPCLAGTMAAAFVRGLQGRGVGACLKHFAANNQEYHRLVNDSVVDDRTLREIYLAAFETVVKESAPWSLMCSYNRLNGTHAAEHAWLLRRVLRDEWGHEGVVITDWGAMNDRPASLRAGLELEMPGNGGQSDAIVIRALREGRLDPALVDEAVARLLKLVQKAGELAPGEYRYDRDEHHGLARRAAEESIVLLKNEGGALPLKPQARVAVVGAFAKEPRYQGAGSSQIIPTRLDAAYSELCALVGRELPYAAGFTLSGGQPDPALQVEALALAAEAQVVVVFAGLPSVKESEGFDRDDLKLPPEQDALIEALAELRGGSGVGPRVVVVLSNGAPVELPWAHKVDAIVEGYLGGQAGGGAIARVLYGLVNPSGKLAETFPVKLDDTPSRAYFPGTPERVEYREGLYIGYRYHDSAGVAPLYPFGHGLSYTSFRYDELVVEALAGAPGTPGESLGAPAASPGGGRSSARPVPVGFDIDAGRLRVRCRVSNTGDRAGAEVVQLYVRDPDSSAYKPFQELKGFTKLRLEAGASAKATFELDARAFSYWDRVSGSWQVEPGAYELRIGASSRDIRLAAQVELASSRWTTHSNAAGALADGAAVSPADAIPAYREARVGGVHRVSDADFQALLGRPLPPPAPTRPFTWNSTLGQVAQTRLGRLVLNAVVKTFTKDFAQSGDEALIAMVMRSVVEMPFRSLVLMGGGKMSFQSDGFILDLCNGRPFKAIGRLLFGKGRY